MNKNRLEAFSDGVIAIIITIMVLELKVPQGGNFSDLQPLLPVLGSYVLSFVYLAIYWNNHHHLLHTFQKVSAGILWANLHPDALIGGGIWAGIGLVYLLILTRFFTRKVAGFDEAQPVTGHNKVVS